MLQEQSHATERLEYVRMTVFRTINVELKEETRG
jgi:hypothetical protein